MESRINSWPLAFSTSHPPTNTEHRTPGQVEVCPIINIVGQSGIRFLRHFEYSSAAGSIV
ncbi:hypothetical protein BC832DRAFT_568953, partial [Gaertneriomyces semiglobifer]